MKDIFDVIWTNNVKAIEAYIHNGGDIHIKYSNGATLLHIAAQENFVEICHLLIKHGADVNCRRTDQVTPLHMATNSAYLEATKILLAAHADVNAVDDGNQTALMNAAHRGNLDIVKLLINYGADLFIKNEWKNATAYDIAKNDSWPEVADYLAIMMQQQELDKVSKNKSNKNNPDITTL